MKTETAKRLLANKTCETCSHKSTEFPGKCKLPTGDISQGTIYYRELAKENTCAGWCKIMRFDDAIEKSMLVASQRVEAVRAVKDMMNES